LRHIAPNQDATAPGLISNGGLSDTEALFEVPYLSINAPTIPQRYLVEVWCEKSTMNDILLPLGERYGVNIVTGIGELSLTRCVELVTRAEESERPVRILYVSDFDPAGASMPVAVARKIEFALGGRDLDIQVRPVVLTHEQCIEYRLPRTPIKDTEGRAGAFEARFGAGATELDALEALHEGELERILVKEVMRYYDDDLDARIDDIANDVQADLDAVNKTVHRRHAKAITALKTDHKALTAKINKLVKEFEKKANPILRKIEQDLEAEAPDVNAYDWPEPDDGDEDDDPLFDSTREYLDQIERYKNHQGKPTESTRKPYDFSPAKCVVCGKAFRATSRNKLMVCSGLCRQAMLRLGCRAECPLSDNSGQRRIFSPRRFVRL
jgi:hypothetical protein